MMCQPCLLFFLQVDAVLFYFGFQPLKILAKVPNKMTLSLGEVQECYSSTIHVRGDGYFQYWLTLPGEASLNIYIYCFKKPQACRTISTEFHGQLPPCQERVVSEQEMIRQKKECNVGNSFFHEQGTEPTVAYDD